MNYGTSTGGWSGGPRKAASHDLRSDVLRLTEGPSEALSEESGCKYLKAFGILPARWGPTGPPTTHPLGGNGIPIAGTTAALAISMPGLGTLCVGLAFACLLYDAVRITFLHSGRLKVGMEVASQSVVKRLDSEDYSQRCHGAVANWYEVFMSTGLTSIR